MDGQQKSAVVDCVMRQEYFLEFEYRIARKK